ncbi:MAG: DoxX family protein, partial [Prevotella sp.]|nr:DoxX family protein [Prevotella sp.]
LLTAAAVVAAWPLRMTRFISKTNQGIVINFTVLFVIGVSLWSLYRLPMFDFRPYHVGANIVKSMEIPEGAKKPKFRTTYIMEKNGERREFALEDYPDSTWTYVDARTELIEKGYEPPIQDLSIVERSTGNDITQQVLTHKGYTFLLVSPHLEYADDSDFGDIDRIYEYAQDNGYPFYCLTASSDKGIEQWSNITGAEYPFCTTDATTLKTIIRSNPGLLLLRDGVVVRKWSHNDLPAADDFKGDGNQAGPDQKLEKLAIGQLPEDRVSVKITMLLLGYVLPLVLLTLADRLWQWTRWLKVDRWRRRKKAETGAENEENQSNNK